MKQRILAEQDLALCLRLLDPTHGVQGVGINFQIVIFIPPTWIVIFRSISLSFSHYSNRFARGYSTLALLVRRGTKLPLNIFFSPKIVDLHIFFDPSI